MVFGYLFAKLAPHSPLSQQFPPRSAFEPARDIPDLEGKVIIVTGGNSGIGYHTVKELLQKNAKVYLAARSPTRCHDAVERLKTDTGGKEPVPPQLDLADMRSIRETAEEFLRKEERLDILFNNAGVMTPSIDQLTAQGYDLQFGINVLGHYFFTKLLLPALQRSKDHYGVKARVINTSSAAHKFAPGPTGMEWTTLKGGAERDATLKGWGNFMGNLKLYGASKMGNIFMSHILIKQHGDFISSCALHPGTIQTDLLQHAPGWQQYVAKTIVSPAPYGALTQLWAGTVAEAGTVDGQYLIPWARVGKADARVVNETVQEEVRVWLEDQLKEF